MTIHIDNTLLQFVALYLMAGVLYMSTQLIFGWRRADPEVRDYVTEFVSHALFEHGLVGVLGLMFAILLMLLLWPLRLLKRILNLN